MTLKGHIDRHRDRGNKSYLLKEIVLQSMAEQSLRCGKKTKLIKNYKKIGNL